MAEVQANRLKVARAILPSVRRDAGAEGLRARCRASRWASRGEYNRESRNGEGRKRRPADRAGRGILAQYPDESARAVEAAVYLHGLAADLAVRKATSIHCWPRTAWRQFSWASSL